VYADGFRSPTQGHIRIAYGERGTVRAAPVFGEVINPGISNRDGRREMEEQIQIKGLLGPIQHKPEPLKDGRHGEAFGNRLPLSDLEMIVHVIVEPGLASLQERGGQGRTVPKLHWLVKPNASLV